MDTEKEKKRSRGLSPRGDFDQAKQAATTATADERAAREAKSAHLRALRLQARDINVKAGNSREKANELSKKR